MNKELIYAIQCMKDYIHQGEFQQRECSEIWKVVLGLLQVCEGYVSIDRAKGLIKQYKVLKIFLTYFLSYHIGLA